MYYRRSSADDVNRSTCTGGAGPPALQPRNVSDPASRATVPTAPPVRQQLADRAPDRQRGRSSAEVLFVTPVRHGRPATPAVVALAPPLQPDAATLNWASGLARRCRGTSPAGRFLRAAAARGARALLPAAAAPRPAASPQPPPAAPVASTSWRNTLLGVAMSMLGWRRVRAIVLRQASWWTARGHARPQARRGLPRGCAEGAAEQDEPRRPDDAAPRPLASARLPGPELGRVHRTPAQVQHAADVHRRRSARVAARVPLQAHVALRHRDAEVPASPGDLPADLRDIVRRSPTRAATP